jgi:hypothetical protein
VIKYSRISSNEPRRDRSLAMSIGFDFAPRLGGGLVGALLSAGAFILYNPFIRLNDHLYY